MTNEERAQAAAEKMLHISWLAPDCYQREKDIILAALDAATAPLVAERERLRELLGQLVRGVDEKRLLIEGPIVVGLGTPDEPYVGWDWAAEWLHHVRAALAEKEPG